MTSDPTGSDPTGSDPTPPGPRPHPLVGRLFDPRDDTDPYEIYARLHAEAPVADGPGGTLAFARYADCEALLQDPRLSNDPRSAASYQRRLAAGQVAEPERLRRDHAPFVFRDPPEHTQLRRLVARPFNRRVSEVTPLIPDIVAELLDAWRGSRQTDVVADLAYPLPVEVIRRVLGVPAADRERFGGWTGALIRSFDPPETLTADDRARLEAAQVAVRGYLGELSGQRASDPGEDLVSDLVQLPELGPHELVGTLLLLLVAGHETTVTLVANGVRQLVHQPDVLGRLAEEPSLAAAVVTETLRHQPPVHAVYRHALEDVAVGGHVLEQGRTAVLLLAAANRDPARHDAPDRFDVDRPDKGHLSFADGPHFCLGAPLATAEAEAALAGFAARVSRPRLLDDRPRYLPSLAVRSLASLPVAFDAVA